MKQKNNCSYLELTLSYISGKWKVLILWQLRNGKKRFSEIRTAIPGITEKMLSQELKSLQEDGLTQRKAYPEVPPRVEYTLSKEGETLLPVLNVLEAWGHYKDQT